MAYRSGRHFLQIPGPTNVPDRVLRAMDLPTMDHRSPEFGALGSEVLEGLEVRLSNQRAGDHLSGFRDRRVGSSAREHALAGRQSPHVRDRALRDAVAQDGDEVRLAARVRLNRLAARRGPERSRSKAEGRQGARDQGGVRRTQRDLDRRHEPNRRDPQSDRRGEASGALPGGYDQLAWFDRLPARRMGRGRYRRRLPEGAHAAAGSFIQCDQQEGTQGFRDRATRKILLGMGRNARIEQDGLLSLHAGDKPPVWAARGAEDAAGGGTRERLRAPRSARGSDAPRGARMESRNSVRGARRILELAHRSDGAGRA